jgi:predicted kinase
MHAPFILIVTGLPASGKTTLARILADHCAVPLIAKDLIKEPLLDVLGARDAAASRLLSDASFRVLAAAAAELTRAGSSCVLEGNFRSGEHEPLLAPACERARLVVQVLCRVQESVRVERLRSRAEDGSRHPGHRDAEQAVVASGCRSTDAFLELPGERVVYDGAIQSDLLRQLDGLLGLRA